MKNENSPCWELKRRHQKSQTNETMDATTTTKIAQTQTTNSHIHIFHVCPTIYIMALHLHIIIIYSPVWCCIFCPFVPFVRYICYTFFFVTGLLFKPPQIKPMKNWRNLIKLILGCVQPRRSCFALCMIFTLSVPVCLSCLFVVFILQTYKKTHTHFLCLIHSLILGSMLFHSNGAAHSVRNSNFSLFNSWWLLVLLFNIFCVLLLRSMCLFCSWRTERNGPQKESGVCVCICL